MTNGTEKAIKLAIEGGWKYRGIFNFSKIFPDGFMFVSENADRVQITTWHEIALDPLFWQALGRALNWGVLHCTSCKELARPVRKNESDPEYWHDCCDRKRLDYGKSYIAYWHQFIDHLIAGEDTESFFKSLTEQES